MNTTIVTALDYKDPEILQMRNKLGETLIALLQEARNNNEVESSILFCNGAEAEPNKANLEEYKIVITKKEKVGA